MIEKIQVLQPEAEGTIINLPPKNQYDIYVKVAEMKNKICTNHMANFTVTSRGGQKYLTIISEGDSNDILSDTMKNKTEKK